jgi:hypothetical protein
MWRSLEVCLRSGLQRTITRGEMRHLICLLAVTFPTYGFAQPGNADKVMADARAALGGEAKIAAVKTFVATGRTRQVRGENLVPIEFEIQTELPDKYSRYDEFPAQDAGPVTVGFVGDTLVLIPRPVPPPPRPGAPPPPPGAQDAMLRTRLNGAKQDFVRLMLGMFAGSTAAFPLTYSYVGQAEAPQGKADVIDIKGPNNFAARLFIAADTHLPIMLSWTASQGPQGGPGAPGAPPPATGAPSAPRASVELRLFFADYRDVDGLKLPFRIRRAAGSETTEETTFDRYRINVRIDPRRFDTTAK